MSDVLFLLRLEHQNMSRLLNALENQLDDLERGRTIDPAILTSILNYCLTYPDECHHPKEDLVLHWLCARAPDAALAVGDLRGEHRHLANLTRDFATAIRTTPAATASALQRLGPSFLDAYRRHMSMEEMVFFPAALKALSPYDWEEIDFEVFDRTDPLFSEPAERQFQALRDAILAGDHGLGGL